MHLSFEKGMRGGVSYAMSIFLLRDRFKWINPKKLCLIELYQQKFEWLSLQVDLETPKELHGLDNDYPLAPNNKEIRKETLSNYQLKIADFYNTAIDKSMCFMMKTCNFNA